MIKITSDIKIIFEKSTIAFATVDQNNNPNIIAVAYCKVVSENQVLITDNFMNKTRQNLSNNKNVSLSFWDDNHGYQFKGVAEVFIDGEWKTIIDTDLNNNGLAHKAAILITINEIWDLSNQNLISKA